MLTSYLWFRTFECFKYLLEKWPRSPDCHTAFSKFKFLSLSPAAEKPSNETEALGRIHVYANPASQGSVCFFILNSPMNQHGGTQFLTVVFIHSFFPHEGLWSVDVFKKNHLPSKILNWDFVKPEPFYMPIVCLIHTLILVSGIVSFYYTIYEILCFDYLMMLADIQLVF